MKSLLLCTALVATAVIHAKAFEVDALDELVGFTVVAVTEVPGEFEGADFDKTVKLANGMVFEFASYGYNYSFQPAAAVFARTLTPEQLAKLGKRSSKEIILYKLLIEDEVYDVVRLR